MLTPKQLKLFGILGKNVFGEMTFQNLKRQSKEKSHSVIQRALTKFVNENLITSRKIGTSKLYKINLENEKVYDYLRLHNQDQLSKEVITSLEHVKKALDKEELFYSLVIFGSYADKTYTKKSDLDIAIFIDEDAKKKKIKIALNSAANKTLITIDPHILSIKEFEELLKTDYENLGKQIFRKNLPFYNPATFYKLLLRGIKNGFNPIS